MFKRSEKGFFGTYVHRDENNNITGTSEPNPLFRREMIHKDTSGKVTGKSTPDFGGGFVHYDESGNIVYYNRSPYYISNNLQERKYLLRSNSGGYVPAVKHGEIYINLINNKEIAFINGKAEGYIPSLEYVTFGHGRSYYL